MWLSLKAGPPAGIRAGVDIRPIGCSLRPLGRVLRLRRAAIAVVPGQGSCNSVRQGRSRRGQGGAEEGDNRPEGRDLNIIKQLLC